MPKITLASLVHGNPPLWACQVCKGPEPCKRREVSAMMIHLVQIHGIQLELQSFPPGILQTGAIFHVVAEKNPNDLYDELFRNPVKPI